MPHRSQPHDHKRMENPERKQHMPPEETLQTIGLQPGHTFLDIGAGIGYFALPAARLVGQSGKVYALDTARPMLDELGRRAVGIPAGILETILSGETIFPVPEARADIALMSLVLYEIDNKSALMRSTHRALKNGGTLAVIDWQKKTTEKGPPLENRVSAEEAAGLVAKAGLVVQETRELSDYFYILLARKP